MASWYGILWKHANRQPERLRGAERERLVNAVQAHQQLTADAQQADADRTEDRVRLRAAPAGSLKAVEQP
jgi:hypothetical protein